MFNFQIQRPRINIEAARRVRKAKLHWSWYRDDKSAGHRTVGGVGEVGRLIQRDKAKRKHRRG